MPRTSQRKQVLKQLENVIKRRRLEARYRSLLFQDSDNEGEAGDDGPVYKIVDVHIEAAYESIFS
jgi:hypothetical protein